MPDERHTSALAAALAPEVLRRFDRYARIDTQAKRDRERSPSTPGQLELGRLLVSELRQAGLDDAFLDDNGYVYATLPAGEERAPVVGLIAHMDTTPDVTGAGVEPIVHRDYDGRELRLPRGGTVLDPAEMPQLGGKRGHDILTSSGDTLLGADDKCGVAEIVTAVAHLAAHPELPRPTLRVAFTPDEEIGEGASLFDLDRFGAQCAYTLDGSEAGELQDETFSADEATIDVVGVEAHPGFATGKLVNALRLTSRIVTELPSDELTPETSSGRQPFLHPYLLEGEAGHARLRVLLRAFEDERLEELAGLLERTASGVVAAAPGARMKFARRRQYRNMRPYLANVPEVVEAAEEAVRAEGLEPVRSAIRGGTDGSRLSEMGLPTPNLFTGGYEFHSVREWASLNEMAAAAATLVRLAGVWASIGDRGLSENGASGPNGKLGGGRGGSGSTQR